MVTPGDKPTSRWLRDALVAWEVFAVGLVVTLVAWSLAWRQLSREAQARFEAETSHLTLALKMELNNPVLALDAFRGLFDSPREINPQAWKAFVGHLDTRSRFPGMRAMGYALATRQADLPGFRAHTRGILGMAVEPRPAGEPGKDHLFLPVLFMEPELPRFQTELLGLDLGFEPLRRQAVLQAIHSGKLSATPPLDLHVGYPGGTEDHPGVIFYLPIYGRKEHLPTPQGREQALQGVVFGSMYADRLLANVFGAHPDLFVRVDDSAATWRGKPLYESQPGRGQGSRRGWSFEQKVALPMGQRTWVVTFRSSPTFAMGLREWAPATVLACGLLLSGILFGFTRAQMKGRARAEALAKALQESEDRFRSLSDNAACIIVLYSDVIEYVNDYACGLLGFSREDLLGTPFWKTVHPDDQPMIKARGAARLRGEPGKNRYEFRLVGKDGQEHWIDFTAGKIRWGGRTLGLATAFDISDRVKAVETRLQLERKMLEAQRLESLGLLAGGIAHDFNNLLGAILGHAALVEDSLSPDSPARRSTERIRGTAQQAAELSRQMLAFSGRGTLVVEALSLNQHVRTIRSLLEVSVPKKVQIDLDLGENLPPIKADAGQLHQVVLVLVTNAAEAIQGPGAIHLRTRLVDLDGRRLGRIASGRDLPPGPYVCLELQDSGKGMDATTVARIFDPFFTTKFTGRGLGLAALQGIVQGHGGAIEVESQPGAGSTFRVFFPPTVTPAMASPDSGPVNIAGLWEGQGRILIAEDETALLEATVEVLQRAGYDVVGAADGGQAVDCFSASPASFSLAILDLTMPVLDGRECFNRLRALRPDLKVILASGYGSLEAGSRFENGELAGFLQKPYRSRELIAMVRKVLGEEP
jgi:PAS domain S-box-containing protein